MSIELLKKPALLIPLGLFLASFLLRLIGIGWGMPNDLHNQTYHPDELENFGVSQAVAGGKLAPGFYNYGTAYFMAEAVAGKMIATYGGTPEGQDEKSLWRFFGRLILGGRILSALAGAGMVVVTWLILRRITNLFGSLFGAALVSIAPGFLEHSRFETVDVFATFWLGMSALFALRILGESPDSIGSADGRGPRDMRDCILAGLFAGISTGTKYTGVLVLLVMWVSLGLARRPNWWIAGLVGSVVCFAAFCLTTPGFLMDSEKFWHDFGFELGHTSSGHGLVFVGTSSGFIYHLVNLAVGLGVLATVAGVAGLVFASYRRHSWAIALLVFAVAYYLLIGRAEVKFLRYTFPLLLPLAVGYGYAMGTAFRRKTRWASGLAVVGVFAFTGNPFLDPFGGLTGAAKNTLLMAGPDPRDEVWGQMKDAAPSGTVGLVKDPWFYTPPFIPNAGLLRNQLPKIYAELDRTQSPRVFRYLPADGSAPIDWDPRLITERKPDYIVYSSYEYDDEERLSEVKSGLDDDTMRRVASFNAFQTELKKDYVQSGGSAGTLFPLHDYMYVNPTIWVWKRKDLK